MAGILGVNFEWAGDHIRATGPDLKIENCMFDRVRVVTVRGRDDLALLYPDPDRKGPGYQVVEEEP